MAFLVKLPVEIGMKKTVSWVAISFVLKNFMNIPVDPVGRLASKGLSRDTPCRERDGLLLVG